MYKTLIIRSNMRDKSLKNKVYYIDSRNYICSIDSVYGYSQCHWVETDIIENFKNKNWVRTNHKTPEIIINRGGRGERI